MPLLFKVFKELSKTWQNFLENRITNRICANILFYNHCLEKYETSSIDLYADNKLYIIQINLVYRYLFCAQCSEIEKYQSTLSCIIEHVISICLCIAASIDLYATIKFLLLVHKDYIT